MPIGTSNVDWAEIQTLFGGSNPVSLSEYYAGGSLVNSEQLKGALGGFAAFPTTGQISASDFSGAYQQWTNGGALLTMDRQANVQYAGDILWFRYSNGGADTGSWTNPHCKLLNKWDDNGTSGSGVAQNRICFVKTYQDYVGTTTGPQFEILTPNGQNGTTNRTGNSGWTRLRFVGTGLDFNMTINRADATYTLVGDGYGYTTSSGYSLERWVWSNVYANFNTGAGNWVGTLYVEE